MGDVSRIDPKTLRVRYNRSPSHTYCRVYVVANKSTALAGQLTFRNDEFDIFRLEVERPGTIDFNEEGKAA